MITNDTFLTILSFLYKTQKNVASIFCSFFIKTNISIKQKISLSKLWFEVNYYSFMTRFNHIKRSLNPWLWLDTDRYFGIFPSQNFFFSTMKNNKNKIHVPNSSSNKSKIKTMIKLSRHFANLKFVELRRLWSTARTREKRTILLNENSQRVLIFFQPFLRQPLLMIVGSSEW